MQEKYLTDGRKVVVIGKLNNTEYIVQEIFVTSNGVEVPSGENFTAKSLHDSPVESHHSRELKRRKADIAAAERTLADVYQKIETAREELNAKRDMLENSPDLKSIAGDKTRLLAMFMTGTVKYLVLEGYKITAPVAMEDQIQHFESSWGKTRYEELKLCSVLGRSGGDITFRIHSYSDGSGCGYTQVYPFETLEQAVEKIRQMSVERIGNNLLSIDEFELCVSLGIEFSREQKTKLYEKHSSSLEESISSTQARIDEEIKKRGMWVKCLAELREQILPQ